MEYRDGRLTRVADSPGNYVMAIPGDPSESTRFLISHVTVECKERTKPTVYQTTHVLSPLTLQTSDSWL
jgi:hypothetical protein